MTKICLLLVPLLTALSCYSAGGDGDGDGDQGAGGSGASSSGGTATRGGSSSAGTFGRGGSGASGGEVCGPCPGAACQQALVLQITPDPTVAPANLSGLEIVADGVTLTCFPSADCTAYCQSSEYMIPDGHYALTITAPGFDPAVVEFDALNPTDCGCCGCCPFSLYQQVTLTPDGSALETCCADLNTDALNCGACGVPCEPGASCVEGACLPGR